MKCRYMLLPFDANAYVVGHEHSWHRPATLTGLPFIAGRGHREQLRHAMAADLRCHRPLLLLLPLPLRLRGRPHRRYVHRVPVGGHRGGRPRAPSRPPPGPAVKRDGLPHALRDWVRAPLLWGGVRLQGQVVQPGVHHVRLLHHRVDGCGRRLVEGHRHLVIGQFPSILIHSGKSCR